MSRLNDESVRTDMAKMIQRSLNSVWRSRIINHLTECDKNGKDIDSFYLNDLVNAFLNLILAYQSILIQYDLKLVEVGETQKIAFSGLPRRFEVILNSEKNYNIKSANPIKKCEEFYKNNKLKFKGDNITFYMIFNAYTGKLPLGKCLKYKDPVEGQMLLQVVNVYKGKDGKTIATMQNVNGGPISLLELDNALELM